MSEQPHEDAPLTVTVYRVNPRRPTNREAYVALLDHAAACTTCRTSPVLCPDGQRLAEALRTVQSEVKAP